MPFPTNPALEAAVIAAAEDDLPRLVYADWLDEHGDPARAAFIRVQCALHDKNPADADYPDLIEQRREAFDGLRRRNDLKPKLPAAVGFHDNLYNPDDDSLSRSYYRGFPYLMGEPADVRDEENAADRFRAALPQLLATTTLRGLNFYGSFSRQLHRILLAAECGRLTALSAQSSERGVVDALVRSPMAGSLRWLGLGLLTDSDVAAMAAAELPFLQRWEAHHGFHGSPEAMSRLVSAEWFAGLHRLLCQFPSQNAGSLWSALAEAPDLHTVQVWGWSTAGGLAPLGTAKPFRSLGRLHLHATTPTEADMNGLIRAKFPKLAVLEVTNAGLRNDGLKKLFTADWFPGLRVLELDCDNLGDQGIVALGKSAAAPHLRSLSLGTSKLRPKAFASLARDFPRLTTLEVKAAHTVKMTPAEMAAFTESLSLPRLRHLTLNGWPLGDAGAVALANNPAAANLTRLDLSHADIGAAGVRAILESPHLQRLVYLNLSSSSGGMDALADLGVLPRLAHCWLPDGVSKAVYGKLVSARGNIFVGGPG